MHDNTVTTRILPVDPSRISNSRFPTEDPQWLEHWNLSLRRDTPEAAILAEAAKLIRTSNVPVAFPTETVYGLGADATRRDAVRGIYEAKQRPSDNPLIVHVCSLGQLRSLLQPQTHGSNGGPEASNGISEAGQAREPSTDASAAEPACPAADLEDPIPSIYRPLIQALWPGPLTIILPNSAGSILAPEVTGGLSTFGARIPDNALALALIRLSGVPIAAPSANASTKPSPTAAEHVKDDLDGRIEVILDGGPCAVGVESTVVDGLSTPPCILRPGGISIDQLREFPGWENVKIAYKDAQQNDSQPRAPGMKYRHYSPRARVILHEFGSRPPSWDVICENAGQHGGGVGLIITKTWSARVGEPQTTPRREDVDDRDQDRASHAGQLHDSFAKVHTAPSLVRLSHDSFSQDLRAKPHPSSPRTTNGHRDAREHHSANGSAAPALSTIPTTNPSSPSSNNASSPKNHENTPAKQDEVNPATKHDEIPPETQHNDIPDLWTIHLGPSTKDIARGIFSALRELDQKGVDVIFVEGIDDAEGHLAAAVMNRLRKAAAVTVTGTEKEMRSGTGTGTGMEIEMETEMGD
ncbi:MAG: hypothetical protein M1815_003394 [Lichina confinis]|nr:MAG: hypothetical protein M1815_003394 [Lichina confinis]